MHKYTPDQESCRNGLEDPRRQDRLSLCVEFVGYPEGNEYYAQWKKDFDFRGICERVKQFGNQLPRAMGILPFTYSKKSPKR